MTYYTNGEEIKVVVQQARRNFKNEITSPAHVVDATIFKVGRGLAFAGNGTNTHVVELAQAKITTDSEHRETWDKSRIGDIVTISTSHTCGTYNGGNAGGWESQTNSGFFSDAPASCLNCNPDATKDTPIMTEIGELRRTRWSVSSNGQVTQKSSVFDTEKEARAYARQRRAYNKEHGKQYKSLRNIKIAVHAPTDAA